MRTRLGALTIGQSPRPDITAEMCHIMGENIELVEMGALDGQSPQAIAALFPHEGEDLLVTRLSNGEGVRISESRTAPLMQAKIDQMDEMGLQAILLLCTGSFASLKSKGLLVRMDAILLNTVRALAENRCVGIVYPEEAQSGWMRRRWSLVTSQLAMAALDPLAGIERAVSAASILKNSSVELIVMDCMGYTLAQQHGMRIQTGLPIILARSLAGRVLKEMYDSTGK